MSRTDHKAITDEQPAVTFLLDEKRDKENLMARSRTARTIDKATFLSILTDQLKEARAEAKTLGDPKRSPKAAEVAGRIATLTTAVKLVKSLADPTPTNGTGDVGDVVGAPGGETITAAADVV